MRSSLSLKVSLLLLLPLLGSLAGIGVFAGYLHETRTGAHFLNVAGRQGLLAAELRTWMDMVAAGQSEDRAGLAERTAAFGEGLRALREGGRVAGGTVDAAPAEVQARLEVVEEAWGHVRPTLEHLARAELSATPGSAATSHVAQELSALETLSADVVAAYERWTLRLLSHVRDALGALAAISCMVFAIGLWAMRRSVIRPVLEIEQAARLIGEGKAPPRVVVDSGDELASLVGTFNQMADEVQRLLGALELRRRHAERIASSVPEGLLLLRADLSVVRANRAFCDVLGVAETAVIGRSLGSSLPVPSVEEAAREVLRTGEPRRGLRCLVPRGNGAVLSLRVSVTPTALAEGDGDEVLLVVVDDQTEEERLAAQVRAAERRFLEAVEHATDAVILLGGDGRINYFNKAAERIFGWDRHDVSGEQLTVLLPGEVLAPGGVRQVEAVARDGRRFPIELAVSAHEVDGIVTFTGIIRDVSEQRRIAEERLAMERALAEAKVQAAESASRAKSQFLANMSHEIRTPLNGVLGMTELALDTELSARQREYLEAIRDAGDHLLAVLNDVLDVAKFEAGRLDLESAPFDVVRAVAEAARTQEARALAKGLALRVRPPPAPALWRVGDAVRFRQIVCNLVSNAVKFTATGEVTVALGVAGEDQSVRVTVSDTGIGIPKDRQLAVFEAFTQADGTTTRRFGGTGLGLTICRELVQRMGGRLVLESEEGRGSTFTAELPLPVAPAPESTVNRQVAPAPVSARPPLGLKVLLAEDNPINARVASAFLERLGCEVHHVGDGRSALASLASERFDAILMDVQMPELDGLEVTRRVRAVEAGRHGHVPIIALTASAMRGDGALCFEAGMDGYLTKPLSSEALERELRRVTGAASAGARP